jgi:hypothetical protein
MNQQKLISFTSRAVTSLGGVLVVATLILLPRTTIKGVHANSCPNYYCGGSNQVCNVDNCLCESEPDSCTDNGQQNGHVAYTCGGGCAE